MKVAIIPARGGSKRIPRKNVRVFCGEPIIGWSIKAAREAGIFERVIVSTDDAEIGSIAREYGAETPFLRPPELSDDFTGTGAVVSHALSWMNAHGPPQVSLACCIYPTAPFVEASDLRDGVELLLRSGADYAISVTSFPFPIQRAVKLTEGGRIEMFSSEFMAARSQDLVEAWHDAGQFYWGRAESWLSGRPIFSRTTAAVALPRHRVQDIDTLEDWERAEWLFKAMRAQLGQEST